MPLLLVAMPGATSSVLAPGISPVMHQIMKIPVKNSTSLALKIPQQMNSMPLPSACVKNGPLEHFGHKSVATFSNCSYVGFCGKNYSKAVHWDDPDDPFHL